MYFEKQKKRGKKMCKNLKIGIVTFHCAYNYGSVLQAYALERYLLKNYKNVEVICLLYTSDAADE